MSDTPSRVSPSATETPISRADIQLLRDAANAFDPDVSDVNYRLEDLADRLDESCPRSPSSPVPRDSRSEIKRRVIMQGGTMDEAFEEIKRVESGGTEPEDFENALMDFECAINNHDDEATDAARAEIRGYVSRLQSEKSTASTEAHTPRVIQ